MRRWPRASETVAGRMAWGLVCSVLMATMAVGAEESGGGLDQRSFILLHRSVDEAYQLIAPFLSPRADVRVVHAAQRLEIRDEPRILQQVALEIAAFDVARRQVRLSIRIVKGERSDRPERESDARVGIPPDVGKILEYNTYHSLGEGELLVGEGGHRKLRLGVEDAFRVDVQIGEVEARTGRVELELLSLQRKLKGRDQAEVYRPVIEFREQLQDGKTRVLFATPGPGSPHAIFLLLQARIEEAE